MLTRAQASQLNLIQNTGFSGGVNDALVVETQAAQAFEHWIVDTLCLNAQLDNSGFTSVLNPVPGYSGLFLCPPNTPIAPSGELTNGIQLADDSEGFFWTPAGAVGLAINGASDSCFKRIIVPPLWTIRAVLDEGPGGNLPGATIQILATVIRERQCGQ